MPESVAKRFKASWFEGEADGGHSFERNRTRIGVGHTVYRFMEVRGALLEVVAVNHHLV
jgi:hypothetical protein